MATSPTARSLKYLHEQGWPHVQVVEVWIQAARRRRDLFKFADILAMHPQWGHLYVQATTGSHVNARLEKMQEWAPVAIEDAIVSGARVEIHGWRKLKGMGRRQWFPIIRNVGFDEIHDMDKKDWIVVEKTIETVYNSLRFAPDKKYIVEVWLAPIPPAIIIDIRQGAGIGNESPEFSNKEKNAASELVTDLCQDALKDWPFLELKQRPPLNKFMMRYRLRPARYNDIPGVKDVRHPDMCV